MGRTDILEEIKNAEVAANAKVEQAEADKKAAIAAARKESVQKIQDAEAQARSNYASASAKEKDARVGKRDELLAGGKKAAADIDENIDAKLEKVKNFLNEEFERTLNVTS